MTQFILIFVLSAYAIIVNIEIVNNALCIYYKSTRNSLVDQFFQHFPSLLFLPVSKNMGAHAGYFPVIIYISEFLLRSQLIWVM